MNDAANDQVEYPNYQVMVVLRIISYEVDYPLTVKKLLHPYWRLLAHTLVMCIAGTKVDLFN